MQKRRGRLAGSAGKPAPPFLLNYILKPCHSEPTSGEESDKAGAFNKGTIAR